MSKNCAIAAAAVMLCAGHAVADFTFNESGTSATIVGDNAFFITATNENGDSTSWSVRADELSGTTQLIQQGTQDAIEITPGGWNANVAGYNTSGRTDLNVNNNVDIDNDGVGDGVQGLELLDGPNGNIILTLTDLVLDYDANPGVSLGFNAIGGASNTTVAVDSGLLSFAPINNAIGEADARVQLLDSTFFGTPGVIEFSPNGGAAYTADTNNGTFANLFTSNITNAGVFTEPVVPNTATIAGSTSSAQTGFTFDISAGDFAIVTSNFDIIIPTPGSMALFGLGGLVAMRRRRA